jgi:hypothetical protein
MPKDHRSSESGRFVKESYAKEHKDTTVSEKRGGGSTGGAHRDASTGRFVDETKAKANPKGTLKES